MNSPNSPLVHLGCAAGVAVAGVSACLAGASVDMAEWLLEHWYIAPLGMLVALAAAYLLEYALTTSAMLALLAIGMVCCGLSMVVVKPLAPAWVLLAGPFGYFITAALVLYFWESRLYRWQLGSLFTLGACVWAGMASGLYGSEPPVALVGMLLVGLTAVYQLILFFGREYFEITSETCVRSTVVAMVLLLAKPVYFTLRSICLGSYYGLSCILRFVYHWIRWGL
ncbi:MAG: hypothetical protein J6R92_05925 [Akkermansia sp.]|nr:hypothetical protein [Akkermansia sp.]